MNSHADFSVLGKLQHTRVSPTTRVNRLSLKILVPGEKTTETTNTLYVLRVKSALVGRRVRLTGPVRFCTRSRTDFIDTNDYFESIFQKK